MTWKIIWIWSERICSFAKQRIYCPRNFFCLSWGWYAQSPIGWTNASQENLGKCLSGIIVTTRLEPHSSPLSASIWTFCDYFGKVRILNFSFSNPCCFHLQADMVSCGRSRSTLMVSSGDFWPLVINNPYDFLVSDLHLNMAIMAPKTSYPQCIKDHRGEREMP